MKPYLFPLALLLCAGTGCRHVPPKPTGKQDPIPDSMIMPTRSAKSAAAILYKDSIDIAEQPDSGSAIIHMRPNQHIILKVHPDKAVRLWISVVPLDSGGNVRIAQIIDPDGNADGPWNNERIFTLKKKGVYYIRLGQNIMAGDPWEGNFELNYLFK